MTYIHEVALKQCSLVIFRSQQVKVNYLKSFPFLRKLKTVVIPNAHIPIEPKHQKKQVYKKLSLPPNTSLISYIGRLDPIKHVDTLLESFFLLKHKQSHLLICYPEPINTLEKETAQTLFKLTTQNLQTITFYQENKKNISHQDILSSSDVVVSLSDVESLIMLQAFALGIPYLTNTQEVSTIAAISKSLFINSKQPKQIAKAMESILKLSPSKRKKLKTKMKNYTKQFTLSKTLTHISKALSTALPQSL